jgi:nucleotide-binding universal stress UspA family protein
MTNNELIVVGVDGSEGSRRALRWAVTEARRANAAVEAITAWYECVRLSACPVVIIPLSHTKAAKGVADLVPVS